jgi:hypothetical protein
LERRLDLTTRGCVILDRFLNISEPIPFQWGESRGFSVPLGGNSETWEFIVAGCIADRIFLISNRMSMFAEW